MEDFIKPVTVLASGSGSTFEALSQHFDVTGLVVSRADAGAVERARRLQVPAFVCDPRDFQEGSLWDEALCKILVNLDPALIVLAGFLKKLGPKVLENFPNRIVNTHPSLLPLYGGKGMYGRKVHEAVLANKEVQTGVTVHYVNAGYDEGAVIAQTQVPVLPTDTAESLEARVQKIEKEFLIQTLKSAFFEGQKPHTAP